MKEESSNILKEKILNNLSEALDETIEFLGDLLENNADRNAQTNGGEKKCSYTMTPKIRIDFKTPGAFKVKATINVKNEDSCNGEAEEEFSTEGTVQGELEMNGESSKEPDENEE